ncbi:MAG: flagellar FlbD family protein [Elusimicrobiota bacterium]|nr:flagellar FlbD family protein [Endomicrobiia bacterium]MDW8165862.1 flagellar FlbD family protein [Elusimicrobiota bacterium]
MIKLHKLNGQEIVLNLELIESIEAIPETKIILTTGNQYIVKETIDEIIEKISEYKAKIELIKDRDKSIRIKKSEEL